MKGEYTGSKMFGCGDEPERPKDTHQENSGNRLKPGRPQKPPPAPKLLYWLQHSWAKPIIRLNQIVTYGPGSIRTREKALAQAEILEQAGWLIPAEELKREQRQRIWRTHLVAMSRSIRSG
jgi:hypothetical protein